MGSQSCGGTTFTVEVEQTEITEGILLLEDENFYPKADFPYYYTPNVDGTLTIKVMEGGEFTTTSMAGGLYDANGRQMTPESTSSTAGSTF